MKLITTLLKILKPDSNTVDCEFTSAVDTAKVESDIQSTRRDIDESLDSLNSLMSTTLLELVPPTKTRKERQHIRSK